LALRWPGGRVGKKGSPGGEGGKSEFSTPAVKVLRKERGGKRKGEKGMIGKKEGGHKVLPFRLSKGTKKGEKKEDKFCGGGKRRNQKPVPIH